MTLRLTLTLLLVLLTLPLSRTTEAAAFALRASAPEPRLPRWVVARGGADVVALRGVALAPQEPTTVDLATLIGNLASLDYDTRTHAARLIRRAPQSDAAAALTQAVQKHPDEFVRYRSLVLLTALGERGTHDLMVSLLRDRNDRVREVAYKWLERYPDPALAPTLLAALQSEQAEFVRPALVAALAAVDDAPDVQRALVTEAMRGLDFFREAVIEALGRQEAAYAVETIAGITKLDGPLRRSAIVALGRIGGARARAVLAEVSADPGDVSAAVLGAQCLAGESCDAQMKALLAAATEPGSAATMRGAVDALTAMAEGGGAGSEFDPTSIAAIDALVALGSRTGVVRDQAVLGFSTVALRRPDAMVAWLEDAPESARASAVNLLKEGFERLEEDFAEEQFYAAARAAYWKAAEGSPTRALAAAIIQRLEF